MKQLASGWLLHFLTCTVKQGTGSRRVVFTTAQSDAIALQEETKRLNVRSLPALDLLCMAFFYQYQSHANYVNVCILLRYGISMTKLFLRVTGESREH